MGSFLAAQDIPWGEALAYTRGQSVTAEAVKANGWEDLVVDADSKEAAEIRAEITGVPVAAPKTTASGKTAAKQEG